MSKMNPEVKTLWIEALKSGEYRQGREYLRKGDTYCCLGVLCDLAVKAGATSDWREPFGEDRASVIGGETAYLPSSVAQWANISYEGFYRHEDGEESSLTFQNDRNKLTFAQIAEIIEEKF